jgi:hypothetical protein
MPGETKRAGEPPQFSGIHLSSTLNLKTRAIMLRTWERIGVISIKQVK